MSESAVAKLLKKWRDLNQGYGGAQYNGLADEVERAIAEDSARLPEVPRGWLQLYAAALERELRVGPKCGMCGSIKINGSCVNRYD